jgi:predicted ribosomally synthesized peptide with SipW-like signal peptide
MDRTRKVLLSLLIVGIVGSVAAVGTFSAFSSTTSNSGNSFAAGTVVLADNDSDAAMYSLSNQGPGSTTVKCIKLTYTGSLSADVKLYTTSSVNASAQYFNLTIEKGTSDTSTFPNCGTFTSEATIYNGTLSNFASTKNSYANGVAAFPGSQTSWAQNDTLVYRFTISVQDDNNAQGATSGSHAFTWEARNQ